MKGISLIKIKFKGYALEFNKKMIPQDAMKIKKGLKNNKNPSQSKPLEKQVEDYFFCLLLSFH
ncbi:hypothetical protein HPPN120_04230 [Helicobacter pylori Puno120]|uniref:hypothetical protein n=1 Tax=Helicobacter pylori TaxID=210 RepID=UPI0002291259|nr:hypothetical protein [Helicobacter pylori]AEN15461.1 hypothetical protein HPPN120_04230 [Helicobacter pylori Puno120]